MKQKFIMQTAPSSRYLHTNLLKAMPPHALNAPFDIVITKSLAEKYFGKNTSAIGKTLRTVYDTYKVTGVIEDVPRNSHLRFDMLISLSTFLRSNQNGQPNWGSFINYTYVLLKPGASMPGFQ